MTQKLTKRQREVLKKLHPPYSRVTHIRLVLSRVGWLTYGGRPGDPAPERVATRTVECLARDGYIVSFSPLSYVINDAGRKALAERGDGTEATR